MLMKDLAFGDGQVSMLREVFRERGMLLYQFGIEHVMAIAVDSRSSRHETGKQCRAGRPAHRAGAAGIPEYHGIIGKAVNMRGKGLGISPEDSHPVVHVINGDHQDIGFLRFRRYRLRL